jgi:parvulin-like peptidyl-prolyl isomerase
MQKKSQQSTEKTGRCRTAAGYAFIAAVTGVLLFVSIPAAHSNPPQEKRNNEEIPVALVNGMPILPSDLSCAVEAWKFSTRHGTAGNNTGTLNQLIVIELLYQESLKHRFHGLARDAEEVYRHEVKRAGGEEKLRSTLQCNNISLQQFRQYIFRNLAINRLLDEMVYSRISVTDDEIDDYYETNKNNFKTPESVRLRQIFIKAPRNTDEKTLSEIENRARSIFEKASDGSDFVMLARKYTDDPTGASIGGEMGVIYRGNLHQTFESIIFNRGDGSVTEPVRSHSGYHIFQVVATFPSTHKSLEEVRSRIISEIKRSKARTMITQYVSSLKEKADIRILQEGYGD